MKFIVFNFFFLIFINSSYLIAKDFPTIPGDIDIVNKTYCANNREKFGHVVEFLNNDTSLVIFSKNGDNNVVTTFDNLATSFDESTNAIVDGFIDSGRIDVYDKYINNYIYR